MAAATQFIAFPRTACLPASCRDRMSSPRGPCSLPVLREAWTQGVIDEHTLVWGQVGAAAARSRQQPPAAAASRQQPGTGRGWPSAPPSTAAAGARSSLTCHALPLAPAAASSPAQGLADWLPVKNVRTRVPQIRTVEGEQALLELSFRLLLPACWHVRCRCRLPVCPHRPCQARLHAWC